MPGGMDLATLVAAIIQGQNEYQLAITAASTANLMAFHTATAQVRGQGVQVDQYEKENFTSVLRRR